MNVQRMAKVTMVACGWVAGAAHGNINLEWRPVTPTVVVGNTVDIGLYAVSDGTSNQGLSAMDALPQWNPIYLQLLGKTDNGPYAWFRSEFPNDSALDGLNVTWADGNAKYTALSQFMNSAQATPSGLLVTTFKFLALAETPATQLGLILDYGQWSHTRVYGAVTPDENVTGTLGTAVVTIIPEPATVLLLFAGGLMIGRRRTAR